MKACDRDMSISLIRGIAMLMVITCHLCEQLSQGMSGWEADFFLRFGNYCANGVQIFLFISGYLYAGKDRYFELQGERITFLGESFAKILFPYYVYSFLVILPVYARLQPDALTVRSVAGLLLTSETVKGVHHLWFIPYILMCYVLTPALYDIRTYIRKKGISALKVVLLLCIGTEVYCYFFSSFFIPEWICVYGIGYFWRDLCCEVRKKGGDRILRPFWRDADQQRVSVSGALYYGRTPRQLAGRGSGYPAVQLVPGFVCSGAFYNSAPANQNWPCGGESHCVFR